MDSELEPAPVGADSPVACTLTTKQAAGQVVEWGDAQRRATHIAPIEGGVRMTFPATMSEEIADLARREGACCSFLTLASNVEGDTLTLDVTAANPDGVAVISLLAGIPLRR